MQFFLDILSEYSALLQVTKIQWKDIVEIVLISFIFYQILAWIKNTRAWSLLRGIVFITIFVIVAQIFGMTTILWIVNNVLTLAVTAVIIVFQPELRKALDDIGRNSIARSIFTLSASGKNIGELDVKAIDEVVRASYEMGRVKTGALLVFHNTVSLEEYEKTGILVDAVITSQLIINIFEHNTPLHDGAVIISGNRVAYATCYLPLSSNTKLSKDLGTRHRAAMGVSEETDAVTIIVSEETGRVSVAYAGELTRNITSVQLREKLMLLVKDDTAKQSLKEKRSQRSKNKKQGNGGKESP